MADLDLMADAYEELHLLSEAQWTEDDEQRVIDAVATVAAELHQDVTVLFTGAFGPTQVTVFGGHEPGEAWGRRP